MTILHNEPPVQENDPFASLYPHQFFLLTTFRRNGDEVPTTVWFAPDDTGRIYVTTQSSAGKIKRIRNHPEVSMTPSNVRGALVEGARTIPGFARQLEPSEYALAEAALVRKYGEQYTDLVGRGGPAAQATRTFIEIRPKPTEL